jgi:hypothetical protein
MCNGMSGQSQKMAAKRRVHNLEGPCLWQAWHFIGWLEFHLLYTVKYSKSSGGLQVKIHQQSKVKFSSRKLSVSIKINRPPKQKLWIPKVRNIFNLTWVMLDYGPLSTMLKWVQSKGQSSPQPWWKKSEGWVTSLRILRCFPCDHVQFSLRVYSAFC